MCPALIPLATASIDHERLFVARRERGARLTRGHPVPRSTPESAVHVGPPVACRPRPSRVDRARRSLRCTRRPRPSESPLHASTAHVGVPVALVVRAPRTFRRFECTRLASPAGRPLASTVVESSTSKGEGALERDESAKGLRVGASWSSFPAPPTTPRPLAGANTTRGCSIDAPCVPVLLLVSPP